MEAKNATTYMSIVFVTAIGIILLKCGLGDICGGGLGELNNRKIKNGKPMIKIKLPKHNNVYVKYLLVKKYFGMSK